MQPGLQVKSRGLQAFARGKSDSNAHYNASTEKPSQPELENRSTTPKANEYVPSRQELAEFARLPLPRAVQKTAESPRPSGQPSNTQRPQSPARRPMNRAQSVQLQHDIFTGSQLGENFMNSGLSTPVNESDHLAVIRPADIKTEEPRLDRNHIQRLPPRNAPVTASQKHEFSVGEDGRLSVVPGFHRYHPSHMKDGFYNSDGQHGSKPARSQNVAYNVPVQPLQGQARLPMRGVRINRGRPTATKALILQEDEVRKNMVEGGTGQWEEQIAEQRVNESILVNDSDDDFDGLGAYEGIHAISKQRLQNGTHAKPIRDGRLSSKPSRKVPTNERKRRRPSLDYDDKILSSMTYQDLQEEPFDVVPQVPGMHGHDASVSKLTTRLEQFQQQGEREQHQFFAGMSNDDWENAGDWFADQFSSIMNRLRNARREKRQMISEFETEASHREEVIRSRTDAIDRKLAKMKQDGQRVVGEKDL